MRLHEAAPDTAEAQTLLTDYFTWRTSTFPSRTGGYRRVYPDPAAFVPPLGVFLLVVDDDGHAVGCGGIRRLADDETGRARYEVKHVWLLQEARGRGWATGLMTELENRAREFGAHLLLLDTHDGLEDAARLYTRLGYSGVDRYNDNPNATLWFAKTLTRPEPEADAPGT